MSTDYAWIEDRKDGRVFGVYFDPVKVLSDTCKPVLSLRNVALFTPQDKTQTGLDRTHGRVDLFADDTEFFGELTIEKLHWLSAEGKRLIQTYVQERERRMTIAKTHATTLSTIYYDEETIDIRVKCAMGTGVKKPQCFNSDAYPDSLIFHSQEDVSGQKRFRLWKIESFDPLTFSLSRNFLYRYSVLALLKDIAFPPDPNNPNSKAVPPESAPISKRTPQWFVDRYRAQYALQDEHRHSRFQFTDGDRDIFSEDEDDDGDEPTSHKRKRTITPRFPRHVSEAEVYGVFARCAEWILAEQVLKKQQRREVNIVAWDNFIRYDVRPGRSDTQERWGMPFDSIDLDEFTDVITDDEYLRGYGVDGKKLRKALDYQDKSATSAPPQVQEALAPVQSKKKRRQHQIRHVSPPIQVDLTRSPTLSPPSMNYPPSPSGSEIIEIEPAVVSRSPSPEGTPEHIFDPDFSDPEPSDLEEQSDDDVVPETVNLGLAQNIPRSFYFPTKPPTNGFKWRCDVRGCTWSLDLLQLRRDALNRSTHSQNRLGQTRIAYNFARASEREQRRQLEHEFEDIIEDHKIIHLVSWGFGVERVAPDKVMLVS